MVHGNPLSSPQLPPGVLSRSRRILLGLGIVAVLVPGLVVHRSFRDDSPSGPPVTSLLELPLLGPVAGEPVLAAQPAQAIVERAAKLRRDGSYEEAATAYLDALGQLPADAGRLALAAAEAELAARNYARAHELATLALNRDPSLVDAILLQGQALIKLGDFQHAVVTLRSYPDSEPLAGYAQMRIADALAASGDTVGAREAWSNAIGRGINLMWRVAAARRIAQSYRGDGDPAAAATWLAQAARGAEQIDQRRAPIWFDGELVERGREDRSATILLELGEAYRDAGDTSNQIATYASLVTNYPTVPEAVTALDRLDALDAESTVPAVDWGRVLYQADRNSEAMDTLATALADSLSDEDAIRARYYMALARRDAGEPLGAMEDLRELAAQAPESPFARQALAQAAAIAQRYASTSEAIAAHLAVAAAYPASAEAADSLLRAGQLQMQSGQVAEARATWGQLGREHPDPKARARGLFRLGRSLLAGGDSSDAVAVLREAATLAPYTFEGVRARDVAEGGPGAEPFARLRATRLASPQPADVAECDAWIRSWSGQTEPSATTQSRIALINRLQAVGLSGPAQAEALDTAAEVADRPLDLHVLARGLADSGLYAVSIATANRLAAASPDHDASTGCLGRLLYPLAYGDLVQPQADRYGMDPYLLLALLRQESWFNPLAHSQADARGMSQVIPGTAAEIARQLQRVSFDPDNLFRPYESIAFGARYLNSQLEQMGGRPLLALAAYNAGAGNALRWAGQNRRVDPDDFIDAITFSETRTYVRTIYEIYAHYRDLYPG